MARALARSPRSDVLIAPLKRSGGTKIPKARSGSISTRRPRGTRAATPTPPKTMTTGTGSFKRRATTASAVDARRRARSVSKPATSQLGEKTFRRAKVGGLDALGELVVGGRDHRLGPHACDVDADVHHDRSFARGM